MVVSFFPLFLCPLWTFIISLTTLTVDVVKTRAQLYAGTGKNPSIIGTVSEIVKTNGLKSLYRGILPPILMEGECLSFVSQNRDDGMINSDSFSYDFICWIY